MYQPATKITRKQAEPILRATFPNYKGRKIKIRFAPTVTFSDTNWGGGTRNQYHVVRADGDNARLYVPAPWANPIEGQTVELPQDVIVAEHTVFCGEDCGITLYAHPANLPKWIAAPA